MEAHSILASSCCTTRSQVIETCGLQDAAEPLAATAAAASHRLLSIASQDLQRDLALQNHRSGTSARCEGSIGQMHSALRAFRDLAGAEKPILSTEGAGNIVAVVQQLLDKVRLFLLFHTLPNALTWQHCIVRCHGHYIIPASFKAALLSWGCAVCAMLCLMVPEVLTASLQVLTPALEAPLEPEGAGALGTLLTSSAEILAAVASQPHWQELRPHVALAVLSAIGASAVS